MAREVVPLTDRELIARHVLFAPRRPSDARLAETGVGVWIIVEYLRDVVDGDIRQAAADYDLPVDSVRAALAFYRLHPAPIDARILLNASV
jgi:uncharacterized protein (DUF433 family)